MMLLLEFDSEKTIVKEEVMEAIVLIEDVHGETFHLLSDAQLTEFSDFDPILWFFMMLQNKGTVVVIDLLSFPHNHTQKTFNSCKPC